MHLPRYDLQGRRFVWFFRVATLNDVDNNHLFFIETTDPAVSVSFSAGHPSDPRNDLNPVSSSAVTAIQQNQRS